MLPVSITVLDLSAYIGLAAVGAVTINMLLGMLMAFRYSPVRSWPHRRFNYFLLHHWSGYLALFLSILHPAILLLVKTPKFRLVDLVYPVHSPSQPLENTIGSIALYLLIVVVVTSYFRIRLGRRAWKAFHFTIYVAAVALFVHSLLTGPEERTRRLVRWWKGVRRALIGSTRHPYGATRSLRAQKSASPPAANLRCLLTVWATERAT